MKALVFILLPLLASCLSSKTEVAPTENNPKYVVLASSAWVDVTPPVGVPLAGYGGGNRRLVPYDVFDKHEYAHFMKPSTGKRDPIRAKSFLLHGKHKRLLFISIDLVGVIKELRDEIVARLKPLGYRENEVIVTATHTHSGPATITTNLIWQLITTDRFQPEVRDILINGVVESVVRAEERLEEANLFATWFKVDGLQSNRMEKEGFFDSNANLLLAKSIRTGRWLGGMTNLAIHPTSLGTDNLEFSADVVGEIERSLEARLQAAGGVPGLTMVFINGAEGDVSPNGGMVEIGESFADYAMAALPTLRLVEPTWKIRNTNLSLGWAGFNLNGCSGISLFSGYRFLIGSWLANETRLAAVELGDMIFLSWPGEPTSQLGFDLKAQAFSHGYAQSWVMGLTNDHLAYFTSPDEYRTTEYEACSSMYGPEAGVKIIEAHSQMMEQIKKP